MALSSRTRTLLAQIGSFLLAGVLLWLALRGADFDAIGQALREADYRWLLPLVGLLLFSHWLRAWRWTLLLEALPPETPADEPPRVSVKTAFYSVMIGYMVNYAAPRLGEVARSANLAARERLRLSGVIGTVVVERILDVAVLALSLVSVGFLLLDRFDDLHGLFIAPLVEQLGRIPALALIVLALFVGGLVALIYRQILVADSALARLWNHRLRPVLGSFRDGLMTLLAARRKGAIAVSTVAIWFCYLLLAHLPFIMLGITETYPISLLDSWSIMILGAIGVALPSPGGTGSYHYITIETLVHLFGMARASAATYAVVLHAAQLIIYTLTGALCLLLQGTSLRSLRDTTQAAQTEDAQLEEEEAAVVSEPSVSSRRNG